jgi:hypothetical protein
LGKAIRPDDLNEAKRLKELERENSELKKMLAEALLAKRVLEYVGEKIMSPGHKKQMDNVRHGSCCRNGRVPPRVRCGQRV